MGTRSRTLTASARRLSLDMTGAVPKGLQIERQDCIRARVGLFDPPEHSLHDHRDLPGHLLAYGQHLLV